MQPIPLGRRIIYYVILSLISVFTMFTLGGIFREYDIFVTIVWVFIIPHYIFGLFYIKETSIFKFILPLVTAFGSLGAIWFFFALLEILNLPELISVFLPAIVWEIAYQILSIENKRQK